MNIAWCRCGHNAMHHGVLNTSEIVCWQCWTELEEGKNALVRENNELRAENQRLRNLLDPSLNAQETEVTE